MTLKNIIDESLDLKTIMMQTQQLEQLDKANAGIVNQLKNNPDLAKQFQPFQTLVQQQLQQKKLEAQKMQEMQNQQKQNQVVQNNSQQNAVASGQAQPITTTTTGTTANQ